MAAGVIGFNSYYNQHHLGTSEVTCCLLQNTMYQLYIPFVYLILYLFIFGTNVEFQETRLSGIWYFFPVLVCLVGLIAVEKM